MMWIISDLQSPESDSETLCSFGLDFYRFIRNLAGFFSVVGSTLFRQCLHKKGETKLNLESNSSTFFPLGLIFVSNLFLVLYVFFGKW